MSIFIISYDLNKTKDYPKLYEAIKGIGTWCHVLDSTWLVHSESTAKQIADYLLQHIDKDDEIFVVECVKGTAAWKLANTNKVTWINNNM